ncbi:MAG: hypothetical protein JWM14_1080 [Chitinophagaceae bacterium]|nr:hypothetical protein [Chitinophagaceae bacterium]
MKKLEVEDKIRSSEVREVLGKSPGWLITWGTTIIFVIVIMAIVLSFVISYPDIITGRITITTETPPAKLIAKSSGKLSLLVKDTSWVNKGEYLAYIQNSANPVSIELFRKSLNHFKQLADDPSELEQQSAQQLLSQEFELGDVQGAFIRYKNTCLDYALFKKLNTKNKQIHSIDKQLQAYRELNEILLGKMKIVQRELVIADRKYKSDSLLNKEVIISGSDMDVTERYVLDTRRSNEMSKQEIIQNRLKIEELEQHRHILETEIQQEENKLNAHLKNTFDELLKDFRNWEERYVFKAPFSGEVSFFNYWHNNQFIAPGDELASVVDKNSDHIFGRLYVSTESFGKVRKGQSVRILLDSYHFSEYGSVKGTVAAISAVNRNNAYLIYVELKDRLNTSYNKKIEFKQEMQGAAEIITDDLSVIERFTYSLRNTFKQRKKDRLQKEPTKTTAKEDETDSNM